MIILKICNEDDKWAKLESFSSPLILFVSCIDEIFINNKIILSKKSQIYIKILFEIIRILDDLVIDFSYMVINL